MSALAVSTAMVRGSLPSESRTPRSAPRFRNRQASLYKIAKFSRPLTPSGAFLPRPSSLLSLPRVAKNCRVVERAPALVVHLVHVCPVLEEKLTGCPLPSMLGLAGVASRGPAMNQVPCEVRAW